MQPQGNDTPELPVEILSIHEKGWWVSALSGFQAIVMLHREGEADCMPRRRAGSPTGMRQKAITMHLAERPDLWLERLIHPFSI